MQKNVNSLTNLLNFLYETYSVTFKDASSQLYPGLSHDHILEATRWFPYTLPADIAELYQWRNGQIIENHSEINPPLFEEHYFLSLTQAKRAYMEIQSSYGLENNIDDDGVKLVSCFPFAEFNGGWLLIPCKGHNFNTQHPLPVISVFEGIEVVYYSLDNMVKTISAIFNHPDFTPNNEIQIPELVRETIINDYNPNIVDVWPNTPEEPFNEEEYEALERELLLAGSCDINGMPFSKAIHDYTTAHNIEVPPGYKPHRAARYIVVMSDQNPHKMVARCFEMNKTLFEYLSNMNTDLVDKVRIVDFSSGRPAHYIFKPPQSLLAVS